MPVFYFMHELSIVKRYRKAMTRKPYIAMVPMPSFVALAPKRRQQAMMSKRRIIISGTSRLIVKPFKES